jgi:hypothetical protein
VDVDTNQLNIQQGGQIFENCKAVKVTIKEDVKFGSFSSENCNFELKNN